MQDHEGGATSHQHNQTRTLALQIDQALLSYEPGGFSGRDSVVSLQGGCGSGPPCQMAHEPSPRGGESPPCCPNSWLTAWIAITLASWSGIPLHLALLLLDSDSCIRHHRSSRPPSDDNRANSLNPRSAQVRSVMSTTKPVSGLRTTVRRI